MHKVYVHTSFPFFWKTQKTKQGVDETSHLLPRSPTESILKRSDSTGSTVVEIEDLYSRDYILSRRQYIHDELLTILRFGIPLVITFILSYSNRIVDIFFLRKVGSEALAVIGLGSLFTTVAGLSFSKGILTAMDTLVAQAFTGANNPKTVGIILQRALIIMFIFGVFVAFIWTYAESILVSLGQTPELAEMAKNYIVIIIPEIFLSSAIISLRKFLQGLGEMKVTMYLTLLAFPYNIASNYFFLVHLNLGYIGAAYHVLSLSFFLILSYLALIFLCTDAKRYWPGVSKQAFFQWGEFLKLGIPGMLSVSTDWAFEVCGMITGMLGQTSLAAQHVVISVNTLLLMIPIALTNALVVRLGHHLGANQPKKTKLCVALASAMGLFFVFVNAAVMYLYRVEIAYLFSEDEAVIAAIEELMGVGCLSHFALGFGIVLSGTLNAFGKQHIVALLNIVCYYMIGLPFGLYMTAHHGWGLIGVWSGVVLSGFLKSMIEAFIIIFFIDWENECINAAKRISKQESLQ